MEREEEEEDDEEDDKAATSCSCARLCSSLGADPTAEERGAKSSGRHSQRGHQLRESKKYCCSSTKHTSTEITARGLNKTRGRKERSFVLAFVSFFKKNITKPWKQTRRRRT